MPDDRATREKLLARSSMFRAPRPELVIREFAPGVSHKEDEFGDHFFLGTERDLIASGLFDADDFAQRPKRRKHFHVGGNLFVETARTTGGVYCEALISGRIMFAVGPHNPDEGRAAASWSACAWRPPDSETESQKRSRVAVAMARQRAWERKRGVKRRGAA
jgi:hypothetical protein